MTVKTWFLNKNYNSNEILAMSETEPEVVSESEKAYKLKFKTDYGTISGWFPKSVCTNEKQEPKVTETTEIKVGDTILTPDGKKIKVVWVDGKMVYSDKKKCYHADYIKKVN